MGLWTPDRDYNISDNTHVNTLTMQQLAFLLLPVIIIVDVILRSNGYNTLLVLVVELRWIALS